MKVNIKSVLKSNFTKIRSMEDSQVVHSAGNNLCILQIGKNEGDFINLDKQNSRLFDFVINPNRKHIFTAELIRNGVQICSYSMQSERRSIRLSDFHNYLPLELIESIQIAADEYQPSIVYVITRTKSQACISLLDLFRLKIIAHGFVGEFNHFTIHSQQTYQISICGKSFVRRLLASDGIWTVQQKIPKKLLNSQIIIHLYMSLGRILLATKTNVYIVEDNEIMQTINIATDEDSIKHIIKLNTGFITFSQKSLLRFYGEEGDESLYTEKQKLKLNFGNCTITQIQLNRRSEQLYIVCSNWKFYRTSIQQMDASGKDNYFHFEEFNLNYSPPTQCSLSTASGQNYCLLTSQKRIQLWDLLKLCPTVTMQANAMGEERLIKASAINPDGHSLCVGYVDRVRFYRILLNKFRQFGQYAVKNTSIIQYSHGGQLVALTYGKGNNSTLTIVNTLSFKQVFTFKLGFKPSQAVWNQHDDELYVSGQDIKIVYIYQVSTKSKKSTLHFDNIITFIRFDYLTNKLLVSTQTQVFLVDSDQNKFGVKPKINNLNYVFPIQGNYLATDINGGLYYSNSLQFQKYHHIPLFIKQRFSLLYRKGTLVAFTPTSNVLVLKLKLSSQNQNIQPPQNIVLVQREEIIKFFDKVRLLEGQLEQLQNSTGVKLQQQRKKYNQSLQQNQRIFKGEIDFLQKKLTDITTQKSKQQKNNAKVFDELQIGQLRNVNDLQKVYDNKIKLQKQKYLNLEQQCLEQKIKYENIIKQLQQKYHKDIEKARKLYADHLQKQVKGMQTEKQRHIQYKKKVETKLIDLQQEGQMTLFQMQMGKDNRINNLVEKYVILERQYESKMIALGNMQKNLQQLKHKYEESLQTLKSSQTLMQQNMNKIMILQGEIMKKNKTIEQKNTLIEQQGHQIDGLEKAKYVLSFRTTQVRKELEPKQFLIEKLKSELFKLDDQYKKQAKNNFQLKQKAQKLQMINSNAKKEINELKLQLKNKQRLHNELCCQIFFIINNIDPKQWNPSFIKVYQTYIQQQKMKLKIKKKQDNTSEEINRHLIHVQQSLHQVASGNEKMLKGKEKQIMRKMKQNAELVYDLNLMRKRQNEYLNEIKQKNTQISRLRRQIQQSSQGPRSSTRANTANTGVTRRAIQKDNSTINQQQDWIDLSLKRQSDYLIPQSRRKGRVLSANKTMLWRDEPGGRREKSKISDLAKELQSAKNTIMRQDRMIEELNQRLLGLPQQN